MNEKCANCKRCGLYETSHEWLDDWCYAKHKKIDDLTQTEVEECKDFEIRPNESEEK